MTQASQLWRDRRVLVTGATGMVGSWLTRRLVGSGADVVAFVMDTDPHAELFRSGLAEETHVVNGRLEDYASVERSMNQHQVDTVFHLGAQTIVGTARRAPLATLESNVQGTWNVLEAARRLGDLVQRLVVASSDKAYGASSELPYREDTPLAGREPYEVSKSCADLVAQSYAVSYGLPLSIARCGNIYGGGDLNWSRIVPGTIRSLVRSEQPVLRSDGTFLRDYLFVEDVVEAYLALADGIDRGTARGEAYNFSAEAPLSVLEIYRAVCAAMGEPDTEPRVLGNAPGEIKDQFLSAEKARETLGWKPTFSLEEGLALTVEWYRDFLSRRAEKR